jgi:hypothetical protein
MGSIVLYSLFHCDGGKCGNLVKNLPQVILKDLDPLLGAVVQQNFAALLHRGRGFEVYFEGL